MTPIRLAPISATLIPLLFLAAPPAQADDAPEAPEVMEAENCFPVKGVRKTLTKFDSLKASKRDTVQAGMALSFDLEEGEVMPERHELRDGDRIVPVTFDEHNRSVGLADLLRQVSDEAELCGVDPARAGRLRSERGYSASFGMSVSYIDRSGMHTLEQIEDGLKDGKSHYKKMAGAMGFMVPKFDHIVVSAPGDGAPPRVVAVAGGVDLGEPDFEMFDGGRMIDVDVLEEMGADAIRIESDFYYMSPSPSAKIVAKFMGGGDDEEKGSEEG